MRLSLEPGVTLEPGRCTAQVAPPGFLVDLLLQPEVDRYTTLYLYGVSSRILHRLPRRAPRLAVQSCMTVRQLLASLREAYPTIVIVGNDEGIFSSHEGEERDVIFAVGWTLQDERGFMLLGMTKDLIRPFAADAIPLPRRQGHRHLDGMQKQWLRDRQPSAPRTPGLVACRAGLRLDGTSAKRGRFILIVSYHHFVRRFVSWSERSSQKNYQ